MKEQPTNSQNNAELCAKDMSAATRQEKIDWLMQIIDNELDRGEEMRDEELIWECMETLEQLSEQPNAAIPSPIQKTERTTFRVPRSKRIKKVILRLSAVAAVIAISVSLPIYAHAQTLVRRDQQMLTDAVSYAQAMEKLEADPSETTDPSVSPISPAPPTASGVSQDIFFRMTDLFWEYPTIDFYYPRQNLQTPDYMKTDLKQVAITYDSDESWVVVLSFDHPSLKNFIVQKQVSTAKYITPSKDSAATQGQGIYTVDTADGMLYETCFSRSGLRYTVQALDEDGIRLALSSMGSMHEYYQTVEELEDNWKHLWGFQLPNKIPKGYTLSRIEVRHQCNAEWNLIFDYASEEGYSVQCYVRRTLNGEVISSHYAVADPNIQWIYRRYRFETE